VFVYAKILDENGTLITNADQPITFEIAEGENAQLIGENPIVAEAGIATILLKTEHFKKAVTIKAKADALKEATLTLQPQP
jgi:beta-galactosidase